MYLDMLWGAASTDASAAARIYAHSGIKHPFQPISRSPDALLNVHYTADAERVGTPPA